MNLNETPSANRLHIIILGACNSGKSSVVNFIASQNVSLVSDTRGTTTDPVRKAMELPGIGPVVFIDTAGFDDTSMLGSDRIAMTEKALEEADIALLLTGESDQFESEWSGHLKERNIPTIRVVNKIDLGRPVPSEAIGISTTAKIGKSALLDAISRVIPPEYGEPALFAWARETW